MDIRPVNPGHVLVIPREHAPYLAKLDPEVGGDMFQTGMRVAAAIRNSGVRAEGVNFFLADGEAAMQEVFHAHLHVIPRYTGDGFGLTFSESYYQKTPRAELEVVCRQIVTAWE
jgi:histidine triad (HIT) family protein